MDRSFFHDLITRITKGKKAREIVMIPEFGFEHGTSILLPKSRTEEQLLEYPLLVWQIPCCVPVLALVVTMVA